MKEELIRKLQRWQQVKLEADLAKNLEMVLRKECLSLAFPEGKVGTNTMALGNDYKLKGVYKLNYSFDDAALDPVLTQLAKEHQVQTDSLVRVKREPAMTEIKKLTEDQRLILEEAMISRPGTPTLEIVEPKKKK